MIFFDIDGTLLDHERAETLAASDFYDHINQELELDEEQFILRWQELSEYYYNQYLSKALSFQEQRRMRVKKIIGNPLSDQEADELFAFYVEKYKQNWCAYHDVMTCLQQLKAKGYSLGVISNGQLSLQKAKLQQMGVEDYFDYVVASSEAGAAKPQEEIFLKACRWARVSVENSYYVGDRLDVDALASLKVGMNAIWLNRKGAAEVEAEVQMVRTLDDVVSIVCRD